MSCLGLPSGVVFGNEISRVSIASFFLAFYVFVYIQHLGGTMALALGDIRVPFSLLWARCMAIYTNLGLQFNCVIPPIWVCAACSVRQIGS